MPPFPLFASRTLLASLALLAALPVRADAIDDGLGKIDHIVVIYAENRSFDHLYGNFPGAEGIAQATTEQKTQIDHDGKPLPQLLVFGRDGKPDPRFPAMPNGPFRIDADPINAPLDKVVLSPTHAFYHNQEQINGGRNNKFVALSSVGGWTMGYYDTSKLRLWQLAKQYTLADHFFMGAFGGSFLNHQWLICACAPRFDNSPEFMRTKLDADGSMTRKPDSPSATVGAVKLATGVAALSPDGWAVNTSQPPYQPSGIPPAPGGSPDLANGPGHPLAGPAIAPQTSRTIGDTLSAKNISWAWYSGGWNDALADGRQPADRPRKVIYTSREGTPNFQPHHQPFNYFARFAPGTADRARHLKDGDDLLKAAAAGTLPQVAFYKPLGRYTQHPSYTDLVSGDRHIADVIEALMKSPQWPRMAIIFTYDENGGFWDHMPPPTGEGWGDRWGPGTRIPALVISPWAKKGYVDKTSYDTTSIIKLITRRFGLEPLPGVRAKAGDLTNAFAF